MKCEACEEETSIPSIVIISATQVIESIPRKLLFLKNKLLCPRCLRKVAEILVDELEG